MYEYNAFDRLIKIEQGDDVIENTYTANGKKFSRKINALLVYYVYDGDVVLEERTEINAEMARNVYGRNLIFRETRADSGYYSYNGHGDVVRWEYANRNGYVEYEYDEFGQVSSYEYAISTMAPVMAPTIDTTDEVSPKELGYVCNPYRYAGYEYIEQIGIYDLNARYYNPKIARFLSADPYYNLGNRVIGLYEINVPNAWSIIQANNIYVYCGNNPVLLFDFTGYWAEGDEKLSPQAQTYIKYYTALWEEMHTFYMSAESEVDKNNAILEMDRIHTKANEIRALDEEGKVIGNVYDVPLYNQGSYSLCWAFVQVMYEEYLEKPSERRTQDEAQTRAISIAKSVHGYGNDENGNPLWDAGHYPLNAIDLKTGNTRKKLIANASQLNNNLSSGPVYARYSNSYLNKNNDTTDDVEKVSAHVVIVTGVVSAPGAPMLIATNNPWGQSNIQTYNNFANGIPGDKKQMKFEYLYIPIGA